MDFHRKTVSMKQLFVIIICFLQCYSDKRSIYSAYVCPGIEVFDGLSGHVLLVQLSVDLRQLGHPEAITVLPQDLFDATLDLLRIVGLSFP